MFRSTCARTYGLEWFPPSCGVGKLVAIPVDPRGSWLVQAICEKERIMIAGCIIPLQEEKPILPVFTYLVNSITLAKVPMN